MTIKTLLTAGLLALAPVMSFAACSGHTEQAMSCADGMVWDAETSSCVEQTTS